MSSTGKIGLRTATIVGMNAMIGAGIFSVPAALGASVGPAGLVTYAFVILAVWCMGSAMAQLAQHYPQEGSFYTYARQWGGRKIGLLAAGFYLVGLVIAMGHLTHTIGLYLQHYFPELSAFGLGLVALLLLTVFNMVGVHLSQAGQVLLICTTAFPLIVITLLCLTHGSWNNFVPFVPFGWHSVFSAARVVIFGFLGFECAASLFHVVEHPQKNVPRALVMAIILVGVLYIFFVGSLIFAVPLGYFLDSSVPISETLAQVFPEHPWLFQLIHFSIFSAVFGTVHSMIWSAGSLLSAFIRQISQSDAQPPMSHRVHRFIDDRLSVLLIAIGIFIAYVTLDDPGLFFDLTALFIVFAFMLSMGALLLKHINQTPWQRIQTIIGLITAGAILYFAAENVVKIAYERSHWRDITPVLALGNAVLDRGAKGLELRMSGRLN